MGLLGIYLGVSTLFVFKDTSRMGFHWEFMSEAAEYASPEGNLF